MLLQLVEPGQTPAPHATPQGVVVGIDLGTTHSVVAYVKEGKPQVLTFEHGALLPSIVSFGEEGIVIGREQGEVLRSTKRFMGQGAMALLLGPHVITPVKAASLILAHLRDLIETTFGAPLEAAVISVPAYFDEAARVATKQAAAIAGIKVLRLLNEPTAAALAYGLETGAQGVYGIYDFGGGTFDFSLLKLQAGVFQVLATGGDLHLGGDDLDQALSKEKGISLEKAREIKEKLTNHESWDRVTRAELDALAAPLVERTLEISFQTLKDANLTPQEMTGIVLVGGMTRLPLVRRRVETFFGRPPLHEMNPDETVALGAAHSAYGLTEGSSTLLLDVTPLSLGLETMGEKVERLIPRNTPLPALASEDFTTHTDGQDGILIHVVQGEAESVAACRSLANFELKGIPPLPAGVARIRVDFAVDVDGLLTVTALEKTTGLSQYVEVRPSFGLDEGELKAMLLNSPPFKLQGR